MALADFAESLDGRKTPLTAAAVRHDLADDGAGFLVAFRHRDPCADVSVQAIRDARNAKGAEQREFEGLRGVCGKINPAA